MRYFKLASGLVFSIYLAPWVMAQSAARTEAIFPLYVRTAIPIDAGIDPIFSRQDAFHSVFQVLNPNPTDTTGTYQIFDSKGQAVALQLTNNTLIFPRKSSFGFFGGLFGTVNFVFVGWVKMSSTQPLIFEEEISHSEDVVVNPPSTLLKSRIVKSPASPTRHVVISVLYRPPDFTDSTGSTENTGIGIVFPSSSPTASANGTLVLWNGGQKISTKLVSIPANGQIADALSGLFPQFLPNAIRGILELTFDQDVFVAAIQFKSSRLGESMEEPLHGTFEPVSQQASLRELP